MILPRRWLAITRVRPVRPPWRRERLPSFWTPDRPRYARSLSLHRPDRLRRCRNTRCAPAGLSPAAAARSAPSLLALHGALCGGRGRCRALPKAAASVVRMTYLSSRFIQLRLVIAVAPIFATPARTLCCCAWPALRGAALQAQIGQRADLDAITSRPSAMVSTLTPMPCTALERFR